MILVGRREGRNLLGKPRRGWDILKLNRKGGGREDVDWTRGCWEDDTESGLPKILNLFTSWRPHSSSRSSVFRGSSFFANYHYVTVVAEGCIMQGCYAVRLAFILQHCRVRHWPLGGVCVSCLLAAITATAGNRKWLLDARCLRWQSVLTRSQHCWFRFRFYRNSRSSCALLLLWSWKSQDFFSSAYNITLSSELVP